MDRTGLISALENNADGPYDPSAPVRLAAAAVDAETRAGQVERALKVLRKGGAVEMLRGRGIYVEEAPSDGKVAFLFTGQGSQYIDMGLDLAAQYPVVQATFDEANEVMIKELGRPLTDFIRRNPDIPEEEQEPVYFLLAEVWHLRQGNIIRQAEGPRPRTLPGPEAWYWLDKWCRREGVDLSTWDVYSRVSAPIEKPPVL